MLQKMLSYTRSPPPMRKGSRISKSLAQAVHLLSAHFVSLTFSTTYPRTYFSSLRRTYS